MCCFNTEKVILKFILRFLKLKLLICFVILFLFLFLFSGKNPKASRHHSNKLETSLRGTT